MIESLAEDVSYEHGEKVALADELLREIVLRDQRATYAEYSYFANEVGWTEKQVRDELRRMHSVLRLQSVAGRPEDREAAAIESTTAEQVLAKEGPKIQAKIDELQSKFTAMERDARLSAKRCEEQAEACRQLRSLAPQHVRESVESAVQLLDNSLMRQIHNLEIRENELACCLSPSRYPTEAAYLEMLERSHADAVVRVETLNTFRRRLSPHWQTIKAAMELELAEIREKITELQAEYETKLAPLVARLDYYTTAQALRD